MAINSVINGNDVDVRSPQELLSRLDFWQAFSGGLLAIFICVHLVLEGSVVVSPAITNWIGWAMEETYMAQVAAPIILLIIVWHFWIAARKMPFRAGELSVYFRHSRALKDFDTSLWLVQVFTAIIILVGAFFHVYTVMTNMPIEVFKSTERLHMGWIMFYVFFLPACILHTGIGVYRIGVKYGAISKRARSFWRRIIWGVMGAYLLLGICAITRVWFLPLPEPVQELQIQIQQQQFPDGLPQGIRQQLQQPYQGGM